jgi:hypothetical protein
MLEYARIFAYRTDMNLIGRDGCDGRDGRDGRTDNPDRNEDPKKMQENERQSNDPTQLQL